MNNPSRVLTAAEAEAVIRDRAATYVEEHGSDHTIDEFEEFRVKLSADVDMDLDADYLADVIFHIEEAAKVDNNNHPNIKLTRDGTIDNRDFMFEYENSLVSKVIGFLLGASTQQKAA
ncbi:hypothetical protein SEA_MUFASA8_41 [Arthrobacter phage Mufasa8]|uniref:Uncharacterized protein n=1 Tax=Arthrobacter phage Mufasa8 TaxID=2656526 RepID=A0A649VM40_9CAUD|nr:hypothetical protein HYQ08_gp041 [Arthrobacter phage Mufasa8]QGJ93490.1 hypothetical protein SEA_MUFASA8_41 [Arthrobacter phage Mufasa8]